MVRVAPFKLPVIADQTSIGLAPFELLRRRHGLDVEADRVEQRYRAARPRLLVNDVPNVGIAVTLLVPIERALDELNGVRHRIVRPMSSQDSRLRCNINFGAKIVVSLDQVDGEV